MPACDGVNQPSFNEARYLVRDEVRVGAAVYWDESDLASQNAASCVDLFCSELGNNPVFMPGNVEPRYSEFLTFIGISVEHHDNTNRYIDATTAYRNACLNAIEYLKKWGYTGEQAYLLLGAAPIEGRVSGVVDIPNACCSLYLPTAIFDFDIRPGAPGGPQRADRGQCAVTS